MNFHGVYLACWQSSFPKEGCGWVWLCLFSSSNYIAVYIYRQRERVSLCLCLLFSFSVLLWKMVVTVKASVTQDSRVENGLFQSLDSPSNTSHSPNWISIIISICSWIDNNKQTSITTINQEITSNHGFNSNMWYSQCKE